MKIFLAILMASLMLFGNVTGAYASGGTHVESIQFIQYLDENTALEEVRNGNLDLYYYRIASDRIENNQARQGLKVFESTGGSYSMLINPAESEEFNPFSQRDVRFALNYLVDRKLIVNELMGGYGVPMISNYGPFDSEYLSILNELQEFQFRYNPKLAEQMITDSLIREGAQKIDGKWTYENEPIVITIFIRNDDPVRKSIGELFASELENIGFEIVKDFGDLSKAFVVVYGSDPAELKWHIYTEGWGGRSAFVKYDPIGLAQMYAPWATNTPGFGQPSYWNYQNEQLDELTQKIFIGDFVSAEERNQLIQNATTIAIDEAVRIFLASKVDQYVVNENVNGVVNDFGAGVPTRFTPINAKGIDESLTIGVKQIYQGAWNPVRGLTDIYSTQIWNPINDPAVFKHPFTGDTIPVRAEWTVETNGPDSIVTVPNDAIIWNPSLQQWTTPESLEATSKVTFDLKFSNWHNGESMNMHDVLYSTYFAIEWGTDTGENDKTIDSEYTPQIAQTISTIVGIKPISDTQIEVYVNYWHFDQSEIADWASVWSTMPWEIFAAMEKAVTDGKVSFSRSNAASKDINWLSLIVPNDSQIIKEYITEFKDTSFVPNALKNHNVNEEYLQKRYNTTIEWIEVNNHAVISNGPFYLKSYVPESRTITIASFDDSTYPFQKGYWSEFENVKFPRIIKAEIPKIITENNELSIKVETENATELRYYISDSEKIIFTDIIPINENNIELKFSNNDISELQKGTVDVKLFVTSEKVLRPDFYASSFIVTENQVDLSKLKLTTLDKNDVENNKLEWIIIIPVLIIIGIIIFIKMRSRN